MFIREVVEENTTPVLGAPRSCKVFSRFSVEGFAPYIMDLGFRVQGLGFRVQG